MQGSSLAPRLAVAGAFFALIATVAGERGASAYCRTTSCAGVGTGTLCSPKEPMDCGKPLFWSSPCVGYSLQKSASRWVTLPAATTVFAEAFAAWSKAQCTSGSPRIEGVDMGPVDCDKHEYNQNAGNANIVLFRDDSWPHAGQGDTLALTTVTYNLDTGEIYDADIELNSAQAAFSTGDA